MEPSKHRRKGKILTREQKQQKAEKEKHLLSAKERILSTKREVLKIVESMLEESISPEWFLKICPKLCQQDYDDVVQERSIERVCGYPLCDKPIVQVFKQQYHISRVTNKVYDVTERKCFCCNECYKASNYLKAQLSEVPLHLRQPGLLVSVHLISEKENSGSVGEEIVFQMPINKDDLHEKSSENPQTSSISNVLREEVKGLEEHLSKLEITEHTYEKQFVFDTKSGSETSEDEIKKKHSQNDNMKEDETDVFHEYNNTSLLSNKQMPIPEKTKKIVLIDPLKSFKAPEPSTTKISIQLIRNVFYDWFTEDTMKYLIGKKELYSMKADLLFQTKVEPDSVKSKEVSSIKKEYVDLCLKIDKLPEEELSDSAEFEIAPVEPSRPSSKFVPRRKSKKCAKEKKEVTFAPEVKVKSKDSTVDVEEDSEINQAIPEPTLPLVDSVAQNALRRQVLMGRLKVVYSDALLLASLHFRDIREEVCKIIETFSLTPKNITFKPKEWKCIALVLIKLLAGKVYKDLEDFEAIFYNKLCDILLCNSSILAEDIDKLVVELVSADHVKKLHS